MSELGENESLLLEPLNAILVSDGPGHGGEPYPGLPGGGGNLLLGEEEAHLPLVPELQPEGVLDAGLLVRPVHARP